MRAPAVLPVALACVLALVPLSATAGPVEQWLAARELASLARQERDATLLAAAARQAALAEAVDPSLAGATANAAALLAEADRMAAGDRLARQLVRRYGGMLPRGSTAGRSLITLILQAGEEQTIARQFASGQSAIVYAEADGPHALAVRRADRTECQQQTPRGEILCRWVPAAADDVQIRVRNRGDARLVITLITN
jgi:hypothetical protein